MFYLKYRPKTVEELDNTKVKEIIKKLLQLQSLPHAFLFFGQKGTGKTSTARIIAKAVNCLSNDYASSERSESRSSRSRQTRQPRSTWQARTVKNIEPCNTCRNCLSVDSSSSPDVIELDAASNRGIEDIRNLIKEASFFPMVNRYRVYIVDEAHMITNDAFNALLKTLEEPPSSVIFILATTNQEKIPKTILSRCSIINFGKAQKADIVSMLKKVAKKEKIIIEEQLLSLIAQHADHSFRDAVKILEELATQQKLSYEEGKQFLGLLKENFFEALQKKDLKVILSWIDEFSQSGGNVKYLIEQLLDELRIALLAQSGVKTDEGIDITLNVKDIVSLMKLLTEAYNNLKISPIESLPLEIALVEFYNQHKSKVKN
ncbi:DNA polymerase III, subunit gamma and tau [Candidatus Roizmanbacteria bacterium RIFCSPLOWO2_01_FULL_37_13]|uniref:DNA polymerase III subunit gamma/tau n=1 Tax=Candidatus Roizmanbacteria bacterium RIFCSPHIGHO2_02_FULL_38_11 TaxID=1802039 RepID=A0A1F7H0H5_9BACT|nr:MAG: DNA polymerase III, subunit gamma and tau [Candidatus Roizmanbacteria bacterium RIFCSPHIGHO2_02_FULL_38_11]OGK33754.1 MAG: DNA polymerase III, subunit gamma and tau [Candidatus Roizmanbacteria bacterium RIFCSPHIGHO2_12_FULL_37_9b]OGK42501.1 MAG: DNA polymerase III, subunit gamma and tau [Candidatus Roizmanbacteria bacterium RIFCSPLOWO2_01_FULL_37_13]